MSVPDILPPSPPTTNHRSRTLVPVTFKPIMSTPDDSPASFQPSSGAGIRKRVEFSPWPKVLDTKTATPTSEMDTLKAIPPSRDCQKNNKSILKPYTEPVVSISSLDGTSDIHLPSSETLENLAQQLAVNNKGSSLDAYQILSLLIKAYDETPDDVNTRSCIASITRCIRRDLSMNEQIQSSPIDINLITQALKVAVVLVWSEHFSPLLTDEFRVFIIDRSINALTEHTAPKIIIIHYMHLLAMQNFRSGILSSNNRAVKLLEALQDITNHVQGKGTISERLLIYQKLIEQVKPVMKARANLWIREVFLSLSSSVKDIRDKAISVSNKACAAFPSSPTISVAAREALAGVVPDKAVPSRTLCVLLTQRLEKMVAAKDEATQVPQIWALSMLLCNSTEVHLDSWHLLRDWLKVIQRCFNCSDTNVRSQTFPAWNRFMYISKPHEASDAVVTMLAKPIIAQIERTSNNTTGKGLRPAAVSSYCMLLYYAFRPAATHKQYTRVWNEYIVKVMGSHFMSRSTANADLCSRIIMSLMGRESCSPRIWNENRAHENALLDPEDIPTIDCKWVRAKSEAVLEMFKLLFKHSVWGPSVQYSDQAYVAKAWRLFLKSIRESASKEIKPSTDTRNALAHIISFIQKVTAPDNKLSMTNNADGRSQLICSIAVSELGLACFLESMESDASLRCPAVLQELIRTFTNTTMETQRDETLLKSRFSKLNLPPYLQRCLELVNESLQEAYNSHDSASSYLESIISTCSKVLKTMPSDSLEPCLIALQSGLSIVLEDRRNTAKLGSDSLTLLKHWTDLSTIVADKLVSLPTSQYQYLDDLFSAVLSSCNQFTQNALLRIWSDTVPSVIGIPYGPKLLEAVRQLQQCTEITLPDVDLVLTELQTQTVRNIHIDTQVVQAQHPFSEDNLPVISNTKRHINPSDRELSDQDIDFVNAAGVQDVLKEPFVGRSRTRHNDSQVQFVPVDSSPKDSNDIESQFLTERQKEVRDRQHAEQVVTFPDLRSSPRPRSARGSRAPSADCEIARKAAAMTQFPTTPTFTRQQDALDEDELPSPTPKARHKSLNLADVEIPSSPPSIAAKGKSSVVINEIMSSPPKAQNEGEIDMVNLDDAELVRDNSTRCVEPPQRLNTDIQVATTSNEERSVIITRDVDSIKQISTQSAVNDSNLSATVLETVQDMQTEEPTECEKELTPLAELDPSGASDDFDELSASQLSQSLDWHIAEEARNTVDAQLPQASQTMHKRRKRATSGYADQDRKKRRKRAVTRATTSMSSAATDDSHTYSDDPDPENCIVVGNSSPSASSQHLISSEAVGNDGQGSFTTPAGKRRRSSRTKTNHTPLQVRTRSSQASLHSDRRSSIATEYFEGSPTELLEESVYKSVAAKMAREIASNIEEGAKVAVQKLAHYSDSGESDIQPSHEALVSHNSSSFEIMTALQTALDNLRNMKGEQQANLDLKAIDDLCFSIRYQAQEIASRRT